MNRDPLKEFFTLTLQSVKLNSPHMNIICMLNKDTMYEKAVKENVPFFQWHQWIEKIINKEVLSNILSKTTGGSAAKSTAKPTNPVKDNKPNNSVKETLLKIQAATKEKEEAKKEKPKDDPAPPKKE